MWVKIDDRMHNHRKTRHVLRSDDDKRRDAAPMGLWVMAASWAGQNAPDGWVPADELDRWDDDWEPLADRLVSAGYWWPETRDGEPGFGLVNWQEYNPATGASDSGAFGNHQRWHVKRGIVSPDCPLCPQEPAPDDDGSSGGIAPRFRTDIGGESEIIALPDPNPTRTRPESPLRASADADDAETGKAADRFGEFWEAYDKKVERKKAEQKWAAALKKRGVTADLLIEAAATYVAGLKAARKHPEFTKNPVTWLNGECWNDEIVTGAQPALAVADERPARQIDAPDEMYAAYQMTQED